MILHGTPQNETRVLLPLRHAYMVLFSIVSLCSSFGRMIPARDKSKIGIFFQKYMRGCIHCDNPFVSMLFDDEFESICHMSCKMFSTMNRRVCVKGGGLMRNHDAHGILGTVMDSYISWSIIRTFKI